MITKNSTEYSLQFIPNYENWMQLFSNISKTNLLQSWFYGEAKFKSQKWNVERAIILANEQPIAIIQILTKKYAFIKTVRINQGPLWFSNNPPSKHIEGVFKLLKKSWNIRNFSVLLVAPNLLDETLYKNILTSLGFRKRTNWNLESGLINLTASEDDIRNNLRSNWRRQLKNAEKNQLTFSVSQTPEDFRWIMSRYKEYQQQKTFSGPPIPLLEALFHSINDTHNLWIAFVSYQGEKIANLLVASHGSTCSPLVSWISDKGKVFNAGNFILWNSILHAKKKGHLWFEQGGLNEESIANFKRGIPTQEYKLIGEYISWI